MWSPTNNIDEYREIVEFSIHGLRVEPDVNLVGLGEVVIFSIHGLRVEPDDCHPRI